MAIEGRWTLYFRPGVRLIEGKAPAATATVPVVPCDDAAVERVARYLHLLRGAEDETPCGNCRGDARAVLRAAGG
jgi:hypothetical protein